MNAQNRMLYAQSKNHDHLEVRISRRDNLNIIHILLICIVFKLPFSVLTHICSDELTRYTKLLIFFNELIYERTKK